MTVVVLNDVPSGVSQQVMILKQQNFAHGNSAHFELCKSKDKREKKGRAKNIQVERKICLCFVFFCFVLFLFVFFNKLAFSLTSK